MSSSSERKKPTSTRSAGKRQPLTGMQRWFAKILGENIPIRVVEYLAHVAVIIWTFLLLAAIIFSIGWVLKVPLTLLLIASLILYVALIRKGHALAADPTEELAWYQEPFWNGVLFLSRKLNWSGYDSNLKGRLIIDRRREPVTDAEFRKLPQLAECEVLDIEGCPITDKSLKAISQMKKLSCLVIRDTKISDKGIDALIRRMPQLWIWY